MGTQHYDHSRVAGHAEGPSAAASLPSLNCQLSPTQPTRGYVEKAWMMNL